MTAKAKAPAKRATSKAATTTSADANIRAYDLTATAELAAVFAALRAEIDAALPQASSKIWHGSPVWFIDGYPVVGYSLKAKQAALLFWNGQALGEAALRPVGKHVAAEMMFTNIAELDRAQIRRCLEKAGKNVFKDYASFREKRTPTASGQRKG